MPAAPVVPHSTIAQPRHRGARGTSGTPRARVLSAAAELTATRGIERSSIAAIVARAQVSRRAFHRYFDSVDACVIALIDEALADVSALVDVAFDDAGSHREGLRAAIASVLAFFDERRSLAIVCLVASLNGSPRVLAHRRRAIEDFRELLVCKMSSHCLDSSSPASEYLLASVLGVAYSQLVAPDGTESLLDLAGPLTALVIAYATNPEVVAFETRRAQASAAPHVPAQEAHELEMLERVEATLPAPLEDPRAFRARDCVHYLSAHPGASNREIAGGIGVNHRSQVSSLLASLLRHGLLEKRSGAPGHANSWRLTPAGLAAQRRLSLGSKTDGPPPHL